MKRSCLIMLITCLVSSVYAQEVNHNFDRKNFGMGFYWSVFRPGYIVAQNENAASHNLELMFFVPVNPQVKLRYEKMAETPEDRFREPAGQTDYWKILKFIGFKNFKRYVVEIPASNVKQVMAAGNELLWTIKFPCTTRLYTYSSYFKTWQLSYTEEIFKNQEEIASTITRISKY
ncbi:hypothetical protein SAMN05216464_11391 [Mucilaginibacter pineti]|uniref:Uncharacterized protein n=1 Tax=Mucilaginibacter pineti TaxID=1391627 RepID=A0A1G7IMT2_9SPHI|nr:hypothetical protein [Mucilaginibacter pineti]SDF14001.1 hypothetical protein SAMN05216464_11391 [Mucilaginibacter pineti]